MKKSKKIGPKNQPPKNPFKYLLVAAIIAAFLAIQSQGAPTFLEPEKIEKITISELMQKYEDDNLKKLLIKDEKILSEDLDGVKYETVKEAFANIKDLGFNDLNKKTIVEIEDSAGRKFWMGFLSSIFPILIFAQI